MGRLFQISLEEQCYSCKYCRTELAPSHDDNMLFDDFVIPSRENAHACLFRRVVNVTEGEEVKGDKHGTIPFTDIFCVRCGSFVGIKLVRPEPTGIDGNFLLENDRVVAP